MKSKVKAAIIILIIIVLIIGISLIILLKKQEREEREYLDANPDSIIEDYMNKTKSVQEYYDVKSCIDTFYIDIQSMNSEPIYEDEYPQEEREKDVANSLISKFKKSYIEECNITTDKIISNYKGYKYTDFIINDMYTNNDKEGICIYLVFGKQINIDGNDSEDYGFVVTLDNINNLFDIAPYEYIIEKGYNKVDEIIKNGENIKIDEIEQNEYNSFTPTIVDERDMVKSVFEEYKKIAKYDVDRAYNMLDEKYRNKRFETEEKAKLYLKEIVDEVFNSDLTKMVIHNDDIDYTEYICQDSNGNYFIIKMKSQEYDYTIMLDSYTINIPEFLEKYEEANEQRKVALNLEKFRQMLNIKDYATAYNVLDESFKNNNFKTIDDFKNYVESNLFSMNKFEYNECKQEDELYTMDVTISDSDNVGESKEKTLVMKLGERTEFTMSFNVE